MKMVKPFRCYMATGFTFTLALILMITPFPFDLNWLRPEWLTLVLIYWVAFLPTGVGVVTGFVIGIFMDLLSSMLLGKTALALATVAFMTIFFRNRLRQYRFGQQLFIVLVLVGFYQLILLWVQMIIGHPPLSLHYWISTLTSVLVWPLVFVILQSYQRALDLS